MSSLVEKLLALGRRIIPKRVFRAAQPVYHYLLALAGALIYRFPSRKLKVVGVTGTKGKSTTVEMVNAILEEAGFKTAVLGTIRFKVGDTVEPNLFKMTMPGRFFVQEFLRRAADAHCDWAVMEMTSEGAKQSRHRFIDLDALIFTNLSPEHIESHGSYEKYRDAKLSIARSLAHSRKPNPTIIANADDKEGETFLHCGAKRSISYSLKDAQRFDLNLHLPGTFNMYNALAAATFAQAFGIAPEVIKRALENVESIRGRVEFVRLPNGEPKNFDVVVDYAHTPDSLEQFYGVFKGCRNICILGNTGGGRDTWKRPEMARIADAHCDDVILTNEDPYDEDPQKIVDEMAAGITDTSKLTIIMDRRAAIKEALTRAQQKSSENGSRIAVLITGKGTDPYIMGPSGSKMAWDDATVVREELTHL